MQTNSMPPELIARLQPLGLPAWQYHSRTSSTNDLALAWIGEGAADGSLVLADAQTAGRGRDDRRWETYPGTSLAMSLILRPTAEETAWVPRFTALAALSLIDALADVGLTALVKWPNDVLLVGKKVAGILVEADWQADQLTALVVGMGVNITSSAIPPAEHLWYPATSVESELGAGVDRWDILANILHGIKRYRALLPRAEFMTAWNAALAFRNRSVRFRFPDGRIEAGEIIGVRPDGQLTLRNTQGKPFSVVAGEIIMPGSDGGRDRWKD